MLSRHYFIFKQKNEMLDLAVGIPKWQGWAKAAKAKLEQRIAENAA
jgi:hypothetical protein